MTAIHAVGTTDTTRGGRTMMEYTTTVTIEELAGLLGVSYRHMSKLVENDHRATVHHAAPAWLNRPRALSRRERLDQRGGLTL